MQSPTTHFGLCRRRHKPKRQIKSTLSAMRKEIFTMNRMKIVIIFSISFFFVNIPLHASGYWSPNARSLYWAAFFAPLIFGFIIFLGIGIFSSFSKVEEAGSDLWKMTGFQLLLWLMHSTIAQIWPDHAGESFLTAAIFSCVIIVFYLARGLRVAERNKIWLLPIFGFASLLSPLIFLLFSVLGS